MEPKGFKVIVKGGEVTVEGFGFKGEACLPVIQQLAQQLGQVEEMQPTAEFYEGDETQIITPIQIEVDS